MIFVIRRLGTTIRKLATINWLLAEQVAFTSISSFEIVLYLRVQIIIIN